MAVRARAVRRPSPLVTTLGFEAVVRCENHRKTFKFEPRFSLAVEGHGNRSCDRLRVRRDFPRGSRGAPLRRVWAGRRHRSDGCHHRGGRGSTTIHAIRGHTAAPLIPLCVPWLRRRRVRGPRHMPELRAGVACCRCTGRTSRGQVLPDLRSAFSWRLPTVPEGRLGVEGPSVGEGARPFRDSRALPRSLHGRTRFPGALIRGAGKGWANVSARHAWGTRRYNRRGSARRFLEGER